MGKAHPIRGTDSLGVSIVVPWKLPSGKERWLAAVQLCLEHVIRRVMEAGDTRGWNAFLVDEEGKVVAHRDRDWVTTRHDLSSNAAVARLVVNKQQGTGAFFEEEAVTAFAGLPELGWGVVISQSRAEAWAEIRQTRRVTVIWTSVSILALLLLGGLFTGRITKNLRLFVASAEEFARGNLDARVKLTSRDELGTLAKTFNHMGAELKASREEIEEWNRELTRRVEERTRELEQAHKRLLETSKLAAIGQLGAGVAHEINNPLVGILGNVQLMLMKLGENDKTRDVLKKVEAAAKRCKEVTQNLLRFSEQDEEQEHSECDLAQVLRDAYTLTEQQMQAQGIVTEWKLSPDTPRILGDHRQLMQVCLNLFSNARVAMAEGGLLTISASGGDDSTAKVRVQDTGKGIASDQLDRIFEPFFTTKDVWTNTGLGLSVAYRIVSDHGGSIRVESRPGKGSTFTVTLPVAGGQG
jgi:signal transduction histidine kinase